MKVGDEIEALYDRGSVWYVGTVSKVYVDDYYDITYEDNMHDWKLPRSYIRALSPASVLRRDRLRKRELARIKEEARGGTNVVATDGKNVSYLSDIYNSFVQSSSTTEKYLTRDQFKQLLLAHSHVDTASQCDDAAILHHHLTVLNLFFPSNNNLGRMDLESFKLFYQVCAACTSKSTPVNQENKTPNSTTIRTVVVRRPTCTYEGPVMESCIHMKWEWNVETGSYRPRDSIVEVWIY